MGGEDHQLGSVPRRSELTLQLPVSRVFRWAQSSGRKGWRARLVGVGSTWLLYSVRVSPTWKAHLSCSISRGLRCPFSWAWVMGLPHMSSNALTFNLSLGANCMQSRGIRSKLTHFSWVSWHNLPKVHFKVWLDLSTFLMIGVSRLSARSIFCPGNLPSLLSLETGMLGHYHFRDPGSPNLGIISLSNILATSAAISVLVGNASNRVPQHQEIPKTAWCSWHDSEINLPIFPRICLSDLNGPYLRASGGGVLCRWGMFHLSDWLCFSSQELTVTSTNQLYWASFP